MSDKEYLLLLKKNAEMQKKVINSNDKLGIIVKENGFNEPNNKTYTVIKMEHEPKEDFIISKLTRKR